MPTPPNAAKLPISGGWTIRSLEDRDRVALLRLNAGNYPAVWPLGDADLTALLAFDGHHLVAVNAEENVVGYLLSFPRESGYDDAEMQEFRRLIGEPFVYICQVVIADEYRGRGIGRAFYDAVASRAQHIGTRILCCDVNIDPPNPGSLTFHHKLGFVKIAEGHASNGFTIALLAKKW